MNCIQLTNSLLFTAESTRNNTAAKNANVNDAAADYGNKGSDAESEFSDEAAVKENGDGDTFEFVADSNCSVGNESSDAESEFYCEPAVNKNAGSVTFDSVADNRDESSDAESEFFEEATAEENAESNSSISDIGDENATPVNRGGNVLQHRRFCPLIQ